MPGVTDMGMVWMGASQPSNDMSMGLVANDNNDMMLDHENIYYTPSHHSMSNQSMDDIHTVHSSHMVSKSNLICLIFLEDNLDLLCISEDNTSIE